MLGTMVLWNGGLGVSKVSKRGVVGRVRIIYGPALGKKLPI
jgi:hypothetical protein